MAIEHAVLGYGDSEIEIVDHGWINFSLLEPSIGCHGSKNDSVFVGKASLPTAKR
jgi:hypothetical protein